MGYSPTRSVPAVGVGGPPRVWVSCVLCVFVVAHACTWEMNDRIKRMLDAKQRNVKRVDNDLVLPSASAPNHQRHPERHNLSNLSGSCEATYHTRASCTNRCIHAPVKHCSLWPLDEARESCSQLRPSCAPLSGFSYPMRAKAQFSPTIHPPPLQIRYGATGPCPFLRASARL